MGTPELAAASLEALLRAPALEVVAVVTQPDRPKGRELKRQPSPVNGRRKNGPRERQSGCVCFEHSLDVPFPI